MCVSLSCGVGVQTLGKQSGECPGLIPGSALVLIVTKANKRVSVLLLARNQLEDKSVEKESIQRNRFESIINEFWIINHSSLTVDY